MLMLLRVLAISHLCLQGRAHANQVAMDEQHFADMIGRIPKMDSKNEDTIEQKAAKTVRPPVRLAFFAFIFC